MMTWRTNLVLAGIALLLTLHVLIFERSRAPFATPGRVFPGVEPADVRSLELRGRSGRIGEEDRVVRLLREGEAAWRIEAPVSFPAFLPRVQGLLWTLVDLVEVDEIDPAAEAYGAALPPAGAGIEVRFVTRTREHHSVELGRDFSDSRLQYLYARIDGKKVIVAPRRVRDELSVGLDELRSRALVPVAPADAVAFRVHSADAEADKELRRDESDGRWRFAAGEGLAGTLADRKRVEDLLLELNAWRIDTFEQDGVKDFSRFGLDSPRYTVEVEHRQGTRIELDLGAKFQRGGEDRLWVRRRGQRSVFAAGVGPLDGVGRTAEEFRTRYALDFGDAEVEKLRCEGPGGAFTIRKRRITEEERKQGLFDTPHEFVWLVEEEGGEAKPLPGDRQLIGAAVAELRELVVEEFLAPVRAGGEPETPPRSVQVFLDSGEQPRLVFGARSASPRDESYSVWEAVRSTDEVRVLVETLWPARIDVGPWVFRDRRISRLEPPSVYEIEVESDARKWRLWRVPGEDWALVPPEGDGRSGPARSSASQRLDQSAVNELIASLGRHRFRVEEYAPEVPRDQIELLGLGTRSFVHSVRLTHVDGDYRGFRRLIIGHLVPPERMAKGRRSTELRYARVDSVPVPFLLSADIPGRVSRLVEHLRELTEEG